MSVLPGPTKHKHKTGTNYNTQDGPAKVSQQNQNPDDHKPPKAAVEVAAPAPETTAGKAAAAVDSADKPEPAAAPATDINDLWAKLQSSGVLSLFGSSSGGADNNGGIPGLSSISPPVIKPAAATDTPMDVDPSQATMVAPTAPAAASAARPIAVDAIPLVAWATLYALTKVCCVFCPRQRPLISSRSFAPRS